jgi:ribosomal protein S26
MSRLLFPIAGPYYLSCDYIAVVDSSVIPSYQLTKNHNIFSWHIFCQVVACDIVYIESKNNPAASQSFREDDNASVTCPEGSVYMSIIKTYA